jgi:hypothetical protein
VESVPKFPTFDRSGIWIELHPKIESCQFVAIGVQPCGIGGLSHRIFTVKARLDAIGAEETENVFIQANDFGNSSHTPITFSANYNFFNSNKDSLQDCISTISRML